MKKYPVWQGGKKNVREWGFRKNSPIRANRWKRLL